VIGLTGQPRRCAFGHEPFGNSNPPRQVFNSQQRTVAENPPRMERERLKSLEGRLRVPRASVSPDPATVTRPPGLPCCEATEIDLPGQAFILCFFGIFRVTSAFFGGTSGAGRSDWAGSCDSACVVDPAASRIWRADSLKTNA
jgi:hypothetical protein